jgi:hypothetical protein
MSSCTFFGKFRVPGAHRQDTSGAVGAGRVLLARTIKTVVANPSTRAEKGMTQATRLKPVVVGAAIARAVFLNESLQDEIIAVGPIEAAISSPVLTAYGLPITEPIGT